MPVDGNFWNQKRNTKAIRSHHKLFFFCEQGVDSDHSKEEMSLRDAYHFLRHRRSIADPRKDLGQMCDVKGLGP